jgi:DNA-binding transcriptional LysR family regulator
VRKLFDLRQDSSTLPAPGYNLARFDFVSIRLAVDCARTGSLTSAARNCNLVVPAASRRIRDLEAALGETLFERHSRGLVPTAAGKAFARHGLTLLQEMDNLVAELADLQQGIARHIHLCASTAAITQFLPPLLARYAELHPNVHVDVEEQVSEQVVTTLREGRADIGAFVGGPDTTGLDARDFRRDELVLIVPKKHRLAGRRPIAFVDTLDEQWISLTAGAAMLQLQQQAALASGHSFRLRMQVRSFDAVGHMVASRLGIAALPKAAALPIVQAMGLTWRPLSDAWAQRQLQVAVFPGADPAVAALRDFLCAPPSQNAKAA